MKTSHSRLCLSQRFLPTLCANNAEEWKLACKAVPLRVTAYNDPIINAPTNTLNFCTVLQILVKHNDKITSDEVDNKFALYFFKEMVSPLL